MVPEATDYGFRPAANSSNSPEYERARRAASRARPATRRSSTASSLRPARSYLPACSSASAALSASTSAVRRSTDDKCSALTCACPTTRSAALPAGSTASRSIASAMMAPLSDPCFGVRTGISRSALAFVACAASASADRNVRRKRRPRPLSRSTTAQPNVQAGFKADPRGAWLR